MAVNLSPVGGVAAQFFDNDGNVLSGGKIYTYSAGTSTPATTYTTSAGSIAHSNPIILDSAGRVPTGEIWLTDGINYKFVLKDANDALIATYDNISGINSNFISFTNSQQIITATSGQTVFNLSITYQPGTNSLSVFVDGVNQYGPGAQYAYTETDSDTVTFTNGLHVGALVKFTTSQQQGAGAVNASQVTYDPAGTGAVATNVQAKLRETVSVMDFGAVGDGVTNDTAAIQAAINAAVGNQLVLFPAGVYLVTDTINLFKGSQLQGINRYQGNTAYAANAYGTKINFAPTSLKNLFEIQNLPAPAQTFRSKVAIRGFEIVGDSGVYAKAALYLQDSIYNDFEDLNISLFQYGIYHNGTPINNRFVNIIAGTLSTESVHYETGGTTDVYEQCTFNLVPRGVVLKGNCINMRFIGCLFEAIDLYGMELDKECRTIEVVAGYAEDVPYTNVSTNAMFKVAYSGTTSDLSTTLKVVGGNFAGRNAGVVGSFVDVDNSSGVQLIGPYVARYTNLIKTTVNTANYAVACSAIQFNSCTNTYTDITKISGVLDLSAVNAGLGPIVRAVSVQAPNMIASTFTQTNGPIWASDATSPEGVYTAPVGSIYSRTNGGAGTSFYVKESGTGNTGWVAK